MRWLGLAAVAGIVALVVLVSGGRSGRSEEPKRQEPAAAQDGRAAEPVEAPSADRSDVAVDEGPPFWLRSLEGGLITRESQLGNVTVLFFVVPGCPTCAQELPGLVAVQKEYGPRGVDVVALNMDPANFPDDFIREYSRALGFDGVTWAQDEDQRTTRAFGVRTLGATVILDARGRATYQDAGMTPHQVLRREVERALAP